MTRDSVNQALNSGNFVIKLEEPSESRILTSSTDETNS